MRYNPSALKRDLKRGARSLAGTPGLTIAAVACLALGIAAAATLFSFVDAVLLRPLPVTDGDELVRFYVSYDSGFDYGSFSYPEYLDYRRRNRVLDGLAAEQATPVHLADRPPRRLWGALVSDNYFEVLGVGAAVGRTFGAAASPGGAVPPQVVLGHGLWQRRYSGDPGVVGEAITVNGRPFTVAGVAPEGFHGATVGLSANLWIPLAHQDGILGSERSEARGTRWLYLMGRLKPGEGAGSAEADLDAIEERLGEIHDPEIYAGSDVLALPYLDTRVPPTMKGGFYGLLTVFLAVVVILLLVACANVAGLLLARGAARRRDVAVQLAIGAGRGRLVLGLLVESLLLALAGGFLGVLLSTWLVGGANAVELPAQLPIRLDLAVDLRVLGFALLLSFLVTLVFGLVPALSAARTDLTSLIKEGAGKGSGRSRARRMLVIGQVAATTVMLVGAGLFLRALDRAAETDTGFAIDGVVLASTDPGLHGYDEDRGRSFYRRLVSGVERRPGVRAAALARIVPLGLGKLQTRVEPAGRSLPADERPLVDYNVVSEGYFETMEVGVLRGRTFEPRDDSGAPPVAVVSEALAERLWGDADVVGERLEAQGENLEVVGVVSDVRFRSLSGEPGGLLYLPFRQAYASEMTLHVRGDGDVSALVPALRDEVRGLDPELPVYGVQTMEEHLGLALLPTRLGAWVLGLFGALGLLLASLGLYGLIAHSVERRSREVGIRMAMGARARDVLRLVLRQGAWLAGIGLAVGLLLAALVTQALAGMLYGVSPFDPLVFLVAVAAILTIALTATFVPARRASRLDPMDALRTE